MEKAPKGLRLHIGIFGKRNVGKSSLLNLLTGQNSSIVSKNKGTTTDPVTKPMELLPLGPVMFIDTAGIDDIGALGKLRIQKTLQILDRVDIALIVSDYEGWGEFESNLFEKFKNLSIPAIAIINKKDIKKISNEKLSQLKAKLPTIEITTKDPSNIDIIKAELIKNTPQSFFENDKILSDLIPQKAHVIFVIPIDKEAPKGRIILPQVQAIRDILDGNQICTICKTSELALTLESLKEPPCLVVTDSQAFAEVDKIVPPNIPLTSFSMLFARLKGDFYEFLNGAKTIDKLQNGDKILIAESCTHHPIEDDIARVKIPKLLNKKTGKTLVFEHYSGHDFPDNLDEYKLIIHCGGCMTNRREILSRTLKARKNGIPITNYGIAIAHCVGILDRASKIFTKA